MKINLRRKESVVILDLEGNIDINASNFVETVGEVLINKSKEILCNFEGVNLVDYVGISVIAVIYKNVLNHKGKMKLYNVPSHVKRLFSIVGLDKVCECYQTEEQALESFKRDKLISHILKEQLRRRFKRIPFKGTIEYKQKFSSQSIFYKGRILNLSAIGVFIIARKVFSIGEILITRIYLSPRLGILEVDAKVIWIADKEIQQFSGMGLEFHNITTQKQEIIVEFVEKHFAAVS